MKIQVLSAVSSSLILTRLIDSHDLATVVDDQPETMMLGWIEGCRLCRHVTNQLPQILNTVEVLNSRVGLAVGSLDVPSIDANYLRRAKESVIDCRRSFLRR